MTTYMKFNHVQNLVHEEIDNAQSQKEMASSVEDAVKCVFEGIDSTIFA